MLNVNQDAPLLVVFGQSNAHGHNTHLAPEEIITTPLANVYGLARDKNQAYGLKKVTWSGFTTAGMNLGETQDNTTCLAEAFARNWQARIDGGEALPDLYIIQISIGAQGVDKEDFKNGDDLSMWNPDREPVLIPGVIGKANISLYPLAVEILSLAIKSLRERGKNPVILGLHWNQWETEVCVGGEALDHARENFHRIWRGFGDALGMEYPLYLYRPLTDVYNDPDGCRFMTELFEEDALLSPMVHLLDARELSCWQEQSFTHGIFLEDGVHYRPAVHRWFAQKQWEDLQKAGLVK